MLALAPTIRTAPPRVAPLGFEALVTRQALHEVYPVAGADATVALCFVLGLMPGENLIWLRQDKVKLETGELYPPGLATLGFDPSRITYVPLRDQQSVLQGGLEAARSRGLAAAVLELWGEAKSYDLTASRKLVLAAKASGIKLFFIHHAATPGLSAAETRWAVKRQPAWMLPAEAPGRPTFELSLLRHRASARAGETWLVEWNDEQQCFAAAKPIPPLFKPVAALPPLRKVPLRKAG